jgi:hypothetical protein
MSMTEQDVVRNMHRFLLKEGLCTRQVTALYTDADHRLTPFKELLPFQRVSIEHGDLVVHPDMVGSLGTKGLLFAIEAKGSGDLIRGLGQAECYQDAVHASFLCASADSIGSGVRQLARRRNVGLVAVSDQIVVLDEPELRAPLHDSYEFVLRQIESANAVTTFVYNLPTHYLIWAVLLSPNHVYSKSDIPTLIRSYPMPKDWRSAVRGAQKLGLVNFSADSLQLTDIGAAVKKILSSNLNLWNQIHLELSKHGKKPTLATIAPSAAAVLRLLLLNDPVVQMVREGIMSLPDSKGNYMELAKACDKSDHARAVVFFFNPLLLDDIQDDRGQVVWNKVENRHFRSTAFYQYKSVLKHAGILAPLPLGGATVKGYVPERDIWALRVD